MSELDARSTQRLTGVHPHLVNVVRRAFAGINADASGLSFIVTEGPRALTRQAELVKAGASQTMKSRHIPGPDGYAKAVDLAATVNGEVRWDWPLYARLAVAMKAAAKELGVPLEWGGDWKTLKDGPHFQLPYGDYP